MASISKFCLPDGSEFDIKDETARSAISNLTISKSIEYVTSTTYSTKSSATTVSFTPANTGFITVDVNPSSSSASVYVDVSQTQSSGTSQRIARIVPSAGARQAQTIPVIGGNKVSITYINATVYVRQYKEVYTIS